MSAATARTPWRARARSSAALPFVVLGTLMLVAFVYLMSRADGSSIYYDEWAFVTDRRPWTASALLTPHYQHLSLVPVLIWKIGLELWGLNAHPLFRGVGMAAHLACAGVVFLLARRRGATWLGVLAAIMVLFLGEASSDVLWAFQGAFLIAVACGIGALLAIEARRDVLAALLLLVAIASASVGIPFLFGAALMLLWPPREWRRIWVLAVPVVLYGLWYLKYGESAFNQQNVTATPVYVANMASAAMRALAAIPEAQGASWGPPLAILATIVLCRRLAGAKALEPMLLALLTVLFAFWVLTAFARADETPPETIRYIYPGAVLLIAIGVEALRDVEISPRAFVIIALLIGAGALAGIKAFGVQGAILAKEGTATKARLTALELVRGKVPDDFFPDKARIPALWAGPYFAALDDYGHSPAFTPAQLQAASPEDRAGADAVLISALVKPKLALAALPSTGTAPRVERADGGVATSGPCVVFSPQKRNARADFEVPRGGLTLRADATAYLFLRRFGEYGSVPAATLRPGSPVALPLPADAAPQPWHASVVTSSPVTVCGAS